MALELDVNGIRHSVEVEADTPLLWVIRDYLGLTGTKFSCGIGACGACTVHLDGQPIRSCVVPAGAAAGRAITTIEGVSGENRHPVQQAWIELDAPQCGYCQSGMIMSALALLRETPRPTDADIDAAITNICRCSTYHRVRQAIHRAAGLMRGETAASAGARR
jgi:isoquinoline 1-oxidoreductase subunit alpha